MNVADKMIMDLAKNPLCDEVLNEMKEDARKAFIEVAKNNSFIRDEIRSAKPRFTLEYNDQDKRFKYIFVNTMYELFENQYIYNMILSEIMILKLKDEDSETTSEVNYEESALSELTETSIKDSDMSNDEAIITQFGNLHDTLSDGVLGVQIKVYALQEMYYDRWAAPEELSKIYFYSEKDAKEYLGKYALKYHTLKFTPDEYRGMSTIGYEVKYVKELKVASSDVNLNINCMVDVK